MPKSDRELASDLNNHITRQVEILDRLARIAQHEREDALHDARQPFPVLAWDHRLASNEIGHVGGVHRVTFHLSALEQGWEIWLFHEAVMGVDTPNLWGNLV